MRILPIIEVVVDLLEQLLHTYDDLRFRRCALLSRNIAASERHFALLQVARTDLDANRHTAQLPIVKLPAYRQQTLSNNSIIAKCQLKKIKIALNMSYSYSMFTSCSWGSLNVRICV